MHKKAATQTPWILVFLVIFLILGVIVAGLIFGIPALAGNVIGGIKLLTYSVWLTFWDLVSEILGPILNTVRKGLTSVFYISLATTFTVTVFNSVFGQVFRSAVENFGWRAGIFNTSVWRAAIGTLRESITNGISNFGWQTIRSGLKTISKGAVSFLKGFAVGVVVELAVTFGLDMLSQSIVGQPFAQAIDNAVGGPYHFGTPFGEATFSLGGAAQSAISGAASGAAIGFMCGGPVGAAIGAAVGGIIGFIMGGFF